MAKLWQVTENDNQIRFFWYATQKEAEKHVREYERPFPSATIDINAINFDGNRKGMAEAMNFVISLTCFNEG